MCESPPYSVSKIKVNFFLTVDTLTHTNILRGNKKILFNIKKPQIMATYGR